jgi:hypothetical protein
MDHFTAQSPVDTRLENSSCAGVTVNANPSGSGAVSGGSWGSESASHAGVTSSNKDSTGPVATVLNVGVVGEGSGINPAEWVSMAAGDTLALTLSAYGSTWGGDGRAH